MHGIIAEWLSPEMPGNAVLSEKMLDESRSRAPALQVQKKAR